MSEKADLKRIQADLQEAQAEIETASKVDGSLGDSLSFGFRSLLASVRQLFAGFNSHENRLFEHDRAVKIMQTQIVDLQTQIHGLKISKGRAIAAKHRALAKAQADIDSTKGVLDRISIH
jgi:multidrug resistance efflux pump